MDALSRETESLLGVLEVVGTMAFSVSGALAARRARMDWFGVVVLGVIVAIGGGTLRDLLVGRTPVAWMNDGWPVPLAAASALAMLLAPLHQRVAHGSWARAVLAADAIGLAAFAVVGADIALRAGVERWVAAVLGVVSAVFGGIFRDVMVNERPAVLAGEVYALAAAVGSSLHVALDAADSPRWIAILVPVSLALAMRTLALWRGWSTPTYDAATPET